MDTLKDLDLVRAISPRPELIRSASGEKSTMPTMVINFSTFDAWYEINSIFEGRFLERTVPGAFKKTIRENGKNVKVLFDHGHDYHIGNKVLGPIRSLKEEATGPVAEVELLDTSYNRDLLPGLEAGLYGSSFRFQVVKEEWNDNPRRSEYNPEGLPERTIKEVKLFEFGPVTFPANPASTSAVRGLTDDYYGRIRQRNPERYDDLVARARELRQPERIVVTSRNTSAADDVTGGDENVRTSTEAASLVDEAVQRAIEKLLHDGVIRYAHTSDDDNSDYDVRDQRADDDDDGDDSDEPYGDVPYADPGYQDDGKKRYPIDTKEHVKAAWSYINQKDNASKYTPEQLAKIKARIKAAAKKFGIEISDDSEEQQENSTSLPEAAEVETVEPPALLHSPTPKGLRRARLAWLNSVIDGTHKKIEDFYHDGED